VFPTSLDVGDERKNQFGGLRGGVWRGHKACYSRDRSFKVLRENTTFVVMMILGSVVETFVGAKLPGLAAANLLVPLLALIPLVSGLKVWRHKAALSGPPMISPSPDKH
jgi:hypothetical protein